GNPSAPPAEVASDSASGGAEALDAGVEDRETRGDSDGRLLEETDGDTDVPSPRKATSESAKETDSALDAGRKRKETVEESEAQPRDGIAHEAQAGPPDPASSGGR
ncbi:MAG TPA: hypothetical protein VKB85_00630, partial [Propionibacteriaceae bacterium]|nr:hypothetical protein [Propionibacteriaceae bacterium]